MEKLKQSRRKNTQIQFLRGVFCLFILFFHFTYRYCEIYGVDSVFKNVAFSYFSYLGLIPFFILSGYFLTGGERTDNFKGKLIYWCKRVLLIYSVYLVALIVIYLFSLSGLYGEDRTVSFAVFLQNILFLNVITQQGYVDGAHWYVFALLCLDFLCFVYDIVPKKKSFAHFYWAAFLLLSIASSVIQKVLPDGNNLSKVAKVVNLFLCQGFFPYVFLGLSFYLFDREKTVSAKNIFLLISSVTSLLYIGFDSWIYFLITLATGCCIVLALLEKLTVLEKVRPVIFLGNCSFSIYLLHQNVGYGLINFFSMFVNYYSSLLIAAAIVLVLSCVFSLFCERTMRSLISTLFTKEEKKRS